MVSMTSHTFWRKEDREAISASRSSRIRTCLFTVHIPWEIRGLYHVELARFFFEAWRVAMMKAFMTGRSRTWRGKWCLSYRFNRADCSLLFNEGVQL